MWVGQVNAAIGAIDMAIKMYQHGPTCLHARAFEAAMLAMNLALDTIQEGNPRAAIKILGCNCSP